MLTFNEHTGLEFRAEFEDSAHRPTYPTTAHWRLYNKTTKQVVRDWYEGTIEQETSSDGATHYFVSAEVPGTLNVIQKFGNSRELYSLIVVADKDLGGEYSQELEYYIRKVAGR